MMFVPKSAHAPTPARPRGRGGGKYFAFTEADARAFARGMYGSDRGVTIVSTTVPRGFLPAAPDTRETVARPYIDPRSGAGSFARGEVYRFYDPRGGGWSLHVDDDALPVMNSQMTRPRIIQSPLPSISGTTAGSRQGSPGPDGGASPRTTTSPTTGPPSGTALRAWRDRLVCDGPWRPWERRT
jgi:hypothetical protein